MMSGGDNTGKLPMTDEERLALCQKLDKELDEFIDGLEKKTYTEGWPEDRWEEEMDKHPFFMKQTPENDDLSPLAEGLAKLKYDPDENTPVELAKNYKEDGNFYFKHKKYRMAVLGYTEGIKVKCGDAELEASLYNNRAAAHWHLKNYRSALTDSEKALAFDPSHQKARLRAAKCALEISMHEACLQHCAKYLQSDPDNKEVADLYQKAKKSKLIHDRDERKKIKRQTKTQEEKSAVIKAIIERGIKICGCEDKEDIDLSKVEPVLPGGEELRVHLNEGILHWPVLIMYPEYQQTDIIKACPENVPLTDQAEPLFPTPWDERNEYRLDSVNLYYEGRDGMPHKVDLSKRLGEILLEKDFELVYGTPRFIVLPKGSSIENNYLKTYFK